ncbi:MAG TPA: ABC transporter ATP-binding protein [Anaerolineae bacterium]|nr:ABC transporter ATP-binding protein [Anaerolineae bacterium]
MAIVESRNLTKIYKMGAAEVRALQGVDLVVERGEFLSVMGRSGSGKSTLLNLLGCLDRPTEGIIYLDGLEVTSLPKRRLPRIRREKVGFVFQQFNLLPSLTALENVMLPLRYSGVGKREGRRRAQALLEEVGLGDRTTHRPTEMSGGEQQRVAVARALINDPAIVLADEPTGELDTHTAGEIIGLLHELNERDGQTFIIVTHDPLVAESTDRTIYLQDGMIVREERRRRVNGYLRVEQTSGVSETPEV